MIAGIDFGTTHSVAAVLKNKNGVTLVPLDEFNTNSHLLRSVLFFAPAEYRRTANMRELEKNIYGGQMAIDAYIESIREESGYGRLMQSLKTWLPDKSFSGTQAYRMIFGIDDLVSIILKRIKEKIEEHTGEKLTGVIIGRPVVFSEDPIEDSLAEERLKCAAMKAGISEVTFMYEAVAALLGIEDTLPDKNTVVLLADIGGGTSDFTVAESESSERKMRILSVTGIRIAGDTFTSCIMSGILAKHFADELEYEDDGKKFLVPRWITEKLKERHQIHLLREKETLDFIEKIKYYTKKSDLTPIHNLIFLIRKNYGFMVFEAIDRAKKDLSLKTKTKIELVETGLSISEPITRDQFEGLIERDVEKIMECCRTALRKARVSTEEVDRVFLTGGSSGIPYIQKKLEEEFGKEKIKKIDPFTSVAIGLVSSAYDTRSHKE